MKRINGNHYKNMIDFGIRNLEKHCAEVNELNVFPIPDGDTGTNMVLTLKNGFKAVADGTDRLPEVSRNFGNAIVLGARGNSGVIISQFFKGISETIGENLEISVSLLAKSMEKGVKLAYNSVAHPVEGTILTVLKDSCSALSGKADSIDDIYNAVEIIASTAKASLKRTPELLPVLSKAGVVDSGGAGVVYFFDGVRKYLRGESIDISDSLEPVYIDYSVYNRESSFEFGYCTEILLQLLDSKEKFKIDDFKKMLKTMGGSLVLSEDNDKVKIHLHTHAPEKVMIFCHRYGEFLSLKIENMTIQHRQTTQKYMRSTKFEECSFSVIATASDQTLQKTFSKMGADVVILSKDAPSSQDFIEAFKLVDADFKPVLVFPNSSNSIMSANQAAALYNGANIVVLDCNSMAKCYTALASLDFEETDLQNVKKCAEETVNNLCVVQLSKATRDVEFDNKAIMKDDYFAFCKDEIISIDSALETLTLKTIKRVSNEREVSIVTLFCGKAVSEEQKERIVKDITDGFANIETFVVPTEDAVCHITLSLE